MGYKFMRGTYAYHKVNGKHYKVFIKSSHPNATRRMIKYLADEAPVDKKTGQVRDCVELSELSSRRRLVQVHEPLVHRMARLEGEHVRDQPGSYNAVQGSRH